MGCCWSRPSHRGEGERGRTGRFRWLRSRGNCPLAELEPLVVDEPPLIRHQPETQVLELSKRLSYAESELEAVKQLNSDTQASLCTQISQLQAQVTELTHSRSLAETKLQTLKQERGVTQSRMCVQRQNSQAEMTLASSDEDFLAAGGILPQSQQCDESQEQHKMTLKSLVSELREVTDWFYFGIYLDMPEYELLNILSVASEDALRKTHMLTRWMQLNENPSWSNIVSALVKIRMRGLAERLAKKYRVVMPYEDEIEGHNEECKPKVTKAELLAGIQSICNSLERLDEKLVAINHSWEAAKSDRRTAYEATYSASEAVEEGQTKLKELAEQEMVAKEQLASKKRELYFLQQLHDQMRENEELRAVIKNKEKEITSLQTSLRETSSRFKCVQEEVMRLRRQLQHAGRDLQDKCRRLQEIEREKAELQAEVTRGRMEVNFTLIKNSAPLSSKEATQGIEYAQYQQDQAVELLANTDELEAAERYEDNQTDKQIRGLLVRVSELKRVKLTWKECCKAPGPLHRGSAVISEECHTAYFSNSSSIYTYEWLKGKWCKLPDCLQQSYALAVVGGTLTAIGGYDQSKKHTNTLLSFSGKGSDGKWVKLFTPMPTKRAGVAVVCDGKHLVIIGGVGEGGMLTVVEVMNIETRQWLTANCLPFPLSLATATIVGDNIYLTGELITSGWTRSVLTCSMSSLLKSCQPHTPQVRAPWYETSDMISYLWYHIKDIPALGSTCVTLNGELVAVGGDTGQEPTNAVYTYNPATDLWTVISHMSTPRWQCLAVILPGDRLMVVGGLTTKYVDSKCTITEIGTFVFDQLC